jgi:hypothetical protein
VLSILIGLLSGVIIGAIFPLAHIVHSVWGGIAPGIGGAVLVTVLLLRRAGKRVNPLIEEVQRHLTGGRRELALKTLRDGLQHRLWYPLLEGQLRMQIGLLLYDQGDIDAALAELKRGSRRPWESPAFLACAYFKKHDEGGMKSAFERTVKVGEKEGLAWTLYAWCMVARGKKAEAVEVLKRGIAKLPADERLKTNLELVEQGKKMKVAPYGDRWARFGLDGSKPGVPKQMRGFAQRPGFRQRPQRR